MRQLLNFDLRRVVRMLNERRESGDLLDEPHTAVGIAKKI